MRRLPAAVAIFATVACARQPPKPSVFQPTLAAATAVAKQRFGGDLIIFVSDGSPVCRQAREQVFGATPLGQFIAANFAAVEVPARSADRPRIIVASDRLEHLRLNIVRLDRINQPKLLQQLKAVKAAKTTADLPRARLLPPSAAGGTPWPPRNAP